MAVSFKEAHFPQETVLTCVRWYVASPLRTRYVEELMREREVPARRSVHRTHAGRHRERALSDAPRAMAHG
jgi:transposase-like protein